MRNEDGIRGDPESEVENAGFQRNDDGINRCRRKKSVRTLGFFCVGNHSPTSQGAFSASMKVVRMRHRSCPTRPLRLSDPAIGMHFVAWAF